VPEVDDADPLGWKERYFGDAVQPTRDLLLGLLATGFLPSVLAFILLFPPPEAVGELARGGVVFAALGGVIIAGYRAARCVARERQQGTLDGLLMLPGDRRAIVFAKAKAAAWLSCWMIPLCVVALLLGVLRGDIAWPALLGVPVVFVGWLAGTVGFGLWLSVRCATRERAVACLLGVGLTLCVLMPLLADVFVRSAATLAEMTLAVTLRGLGPVTGLWAAAEVEDGRVAAAEGLFLRGAMFGAVLIGVLGVLLGSAATRRFERRT
jgi:ABC-type transport system involved in multi-copper enzyme maturation permease subunit